MSLNSWLPTPVPLLTCAAIHDRSSVFIATGTTCTTASGAASFHRWVRKHTSPLHPTEASHEILGWRIMALAKGKTGTAEKDWIFEEGGDDDDENGGSRAILKVMKEERAVDAVIVISRYYGGVMLGPVRFKHMEDVARIVARKLVFYSRNEQSFKRLRDLDSDITLLLPSAVLAASKPKGDERTRYEDDPAMDKKKLERLILAREKRVEVLTKTSTKTASGLGTSSSAAA